MTRIILSILLISCVCASSTAQNTIQGRVVLKTDQSPLAGVEIYDHQSQITRISDDQGKFIFEDLPTGIHHFTLFAIEYKTRTDSITIDGSLNHTFEMESWNLDLDAINIIAKKEELFAIKQLNDIEGTSIFAGKKSEVVILDMIKGNLAHNNGRQVYAQVSGLNIYEGSEGGLQLNLGGRGLDPNRTSNFNTRQNGYDISADVLGYPENYYTPPTEAISEIRIIRGASSLQYGTQFGGLIDFRLRKIPSFKKIEVHSNQTIGSFNAFNSFNYVGINKGKASFNAFYNYKRGDGIRQNSEYNAHNVFASLDYKLSDKTKLGFEFTYFTYLAKQAGGLTDQQFADNPSLSTRERNWFTVDWKLYNFNVKHEFSKSSLLTLSLFALDANRKSLGFRGNPVNLNENPITAIDEKDVNGNYVNPRDLIIGEFKNHGAEIKFLNTFEIAQKKSVLLVGSKYYKSNNTSLQGPGSTSVDADFNLYTDAFPDYPNQSTFRFPNLNLSLFAENIFYINKRFSITPGLRWEYIKTASNGDYNQVVFDLAGNPIANNLLSDDQVLERKFAIWGLGLSYKKNKTLQFVANISQNYRSVTFSDIRVVSPTFIVDPNISDERGFTTDIGIKGRVNKILSYDFTVYSVVYDDRIGIILDDRANRVRKNIGKAIIAGTETLANLNIARWLTPGERNYKLNFFINNAFTYSQYLDSEENNVEGKKVEFIPNHNLKTGIELGFKNFDLSYQFSYLSKQYTDVQNSEIAANGDSRSGIIGPIPSYSITDLTLSYQFKNIGISSGINNLWNKAYFTRRATGYPGPGIIPSGLRTFFVTIAFKSE